MTMKHINFNSHVGMQSLSRHLSKGLVQLLNNELKRLDIKTFDSFDTGTFFYGTMDDCIRVNLRSRIANVVHLCL